VLAFNISFLRSTSTSTAVVVPAPNVRIVVDDALSGLLILHEGIDSRITAGLSPPMTAARLSPPMTATRLIPPTTAARLPLLAVSDDPPRALGPTSCASCSAATTKIPPPLSPLSPLPSPSSIVSNSQSHRSVTGICNWYLIRGTRKKTVINMRRAVATATGGGGGNDGGTEGRELFEGVVVVGHRSSVPPSLNPNVSETYLFSSPHGRASTAGGRASTTTMTTVVD
jgi:hypothetical protein